MTTQTLAKKLLDVQKKIENVTKSSSNPHFRSKYADLNEVLDVSKRALNEEGLFISQGAGKDAFGAYLETSIINSEDSQQISGRVYFSGTEDNMQKIGAAITYARRFGLVSLLALESEDDDGEAAVGRSKPAASQAPQASPKPQVQAAIQSRPSRETVNKAISAAATVLQAKKIMDLAAIKALLATHGAEKKEDLTDEKASAVLALMQEKLK